MKRLLTYILLGSLLSACDTEFRQIVVTGESLKFKNDSTFEIDHFVSRLPIVIINTKGVEIPDEPRIIAEMAIIDNDENRFNGLWNTPTDFEGPIKIEVRGFTSQNFPKLQYGFETLDDQLEPYNTELLGLPAENDWILNGPYSDKSLIRNVLMYQWWERLGHYSPRTRFCEVVLNQKYHGLYVLTEQIKWDDARVDINKIDEDDNAGDSLTGGYIIKIDKPIGGDGVFDWKSEIDSFQGQKTNVWFQYDYPKDGAITPEQQLYIQQFVAKMEQVLAGPDFDHPKKGYRKYMKATTFIDFFIMQELAHNVDAYRSSSYFFKMRDDNGGKLHAGPIWDFNLALGNTDGCDGEKAAGWALDHPCDPSVIPFWWKRMAQDSVYKQQLVDRWKELRGGLLSDKMMVFSIDSTVEQMGTGVNRNFERWPILGEKVWPNYFVGKTHQEEIEFLKQWLVKRTAWMDENIGKL